MKDREKYGRLGALAIVLIAGPVYFFTIRPGHDWGGDFALYIAHARNLAQGRPYHDTGYVTDPEVPGPGESGMGPPSYPPVFPLLLAPLYAEFGLDYFVFKLAVQAMLLASLLLFYALARMRGSDAWAAAAAALIFGLSGLSMAVKESVLSEHAYLALSGAAMLAITWIYARGYDKSRPVLAAALAASLILACYATRVVALALAAGVALEETARSARERRLRPFGPLVLLLFAAGAAIYSTVIFDVRGYSPDFAFSPRAYLDNVLYYLRSPASLWSGAPAAFRYPVTLAATALAAVTWARRLRREASFIEWYFLVSIGMVIVYSATHTPRYLMPVFPIFCIYVVEAVDLLKLPKAAAYGILAAGALFNVAASERGPYAEGPEKPTFLETAAFLRRATEPGSVIVSWNPRVVALYTDRRSMWYRRTRDAALFERILDRNGARYVVIYRNNADDTQWLAPMVEANPERYSKVFENAEFQVYEYPGFSGP
jgi:hypothetical protein